MNAAVEAKSTPLFIRNRSIIPTFAGLPTKNEKNLRKVEFHVFLDSGSAEYAYRFDDGETFGYQRGERSAAVVRAKLKGGSLEVTVDQIELGYGTLSYEVLVYGDVASATLNAKATKLTRETIDWVGKKIPARRLHKIPLNSG